MAVSLNLIKTSLWSSLATVIKIISVLIINKVLSIIIGPSGLATFGQFQNVQSVIAILSQGGINSGVTKYTAQYSDDIEESKVIWSSSLRITLLFTLFASIATYIFASNLSIYIFNNLDYVYVFRFLSFSLIFYAINQLLLSILNGLKEVKLYIKANIYQSIFALILTVTCLFFFGLKGALCAMVLNQSVVFVILVWMLRGRIFFIFSGVGSNRYYKKLFAYTIMTITSTASVPITHLFIRNYIGENYSWDAAGYWQAIMYISAMYLMVITTAFSTYYLPRLSELESKEALRIELFYGYKIILPIVLILSLCIFLMKDIIVYILFSSDFNSMLPLFKFQLVGDVIKICSWLLSYVILSKAMVKTFVTTELVFSLSFYGLCVVFLDNYGIIGLSYAYATNYTFYLICMFLVTYKLIFKKEISKQ